MKRVYWITAIVFLVDQVSKYIVVHLLNLKRLGDIDVLPPLLNFRMAWNTGINFGLFDTSRWLLIAIALAISVWVFDWVRRKNTHPYARISAGFLLGGALGNVVDRLIYGAVADFLNMSCCGFDNPYAFNVADISIFVGAFGLIMFTPSQQQHVTPPNE